MEQKYFKILGVSSNSSLADIKKAYRKKAKLLHPNLIKEANVLEDFILLNEVYEYLQNKKSGKVYYAQKAAYAQARTEYRHHNDWKKTQRAKARKRAQEHARMKKRRLQKSNSIKQIWKKSCIVSNVKKNDIAEV